MREALPLVEALLAINGFWGRRVDLLQCCVPRQVDLCSKWSHIRRNMGSVKLDSVGY